jgi:hypothetical protein
MTGVSGPPDPKRQTVQWESPAISGRSDVQCHSVSATTSGDALSILFDSFSLDLQRPNQPTRARKTFDGTLRFRILSPSAAQPERLKVTIRGAVAGSPQSAAALTAEIGRNGPRTARVTVDQGSGEADSTLLEFTVPLPPNDPGSTDRSYTMRLTLSALRAAGADAVAVVIDSVDLLVEGAVSQTTLVTPTSDGSGAATVSDSSAAAANEASDGPARK